MTRRCMAPLMLLLAGCATTVPQFRYYTLDMAPGAAISAPVQLGRVRIDVNEALSRPEIMVRTSPTSVEYYAESLPAASPSADAAVQALSRAVEAIAAQIASDVEQFAAAP